MAELSAQHPHLTPSVGCSLMLLFLDVSSHVQTPHLSNCLLDLFKKWHNPIVGGVSGGSEEQMSALPWNICSGEGGSLLSNMYHVGLVAFQPHTGGLCYGRDTGPGELSSVAAGSCPHLSHATAVCSSPRHGNSAPISAHTLPLSVCYPAHCSWRGPLQRRLGLKG